MDKMQDSGCKIEYSKIQTVYEIRVLRMCFGSPIFSPHPSQKTMSL